MMAQVICYTIYGCPKCQSVIRLLNQKGVDFEEVNIMEQPERAKEVENTAGELITPALVIGSKLVAGENIGEIEKIVFNSIV